jgi:hypothetical protein
MLALCAVAVCVRFSVVEKLRKESIGGAHTHTPTSILVIVYALRIT